MKAAKNIIAISLLVIFLFNTMGYFIAFKAAQYQLKSEMFSEIKLGINTKSETIITINKADLATIIWKDDNNEMIYKGELFDVVKSIENKTSITYYCINDKQEESLFANLDEQINTHVISAKPIKNNASKNTMNDVVKIVYQNNTSYHLTTNVSDFYFSSINPVYTSAVIATNSPPPRFV